MSFFKNLRVSASISFANARVGKLLVSEHRAGALSLDPDRLASTLGSELLNHAPVARWIQAGHVPDSILFAAASLAHGVSMFDKNGKPNEAQALFRCLSALANSKEFSASSRRGMEDPLNSELGDIALSAFE